MSVVDKLLGRVPEAPEVPLLTAASPFRAPGTPDADMAGFRKIGGRTSHGDPNRDLMPLEHEQHLRMADYLATRNPMGRRMVGIYRDMTLGDNVSYDPGKGATDKAKEVLDDFWRANDMETRPGRWAEGLSRTGERIIPASVDAKGRVRVGFVHPADVDEIKYNVMDDIPRLVCMKDTLDQDGKVLPVVREYQEDDEDKPADQQAGYLAGEVFYWYVNRSEGQARGMSDLLPFSDWLDALDELVFVGMDRAKTALHVFFDVTLEGMDETDILKWLATAQPPKPGTLRAHNELVKWELKAPELAASEIHQLHQDIKEHILGNAGFPLHWFGTGEGANRAVASEMSMPTLRMLRARRAYMVAGLKQILQFVIDSATLKGDLSEKDRASVSITVNIPELEDSKLGSLSQAFQQTVSAVAMAQEQGWIPESVAQRVVQILLAEIGVEFSPEDAKEELDKARDAAGASMEAAMEAAQDRARKALAGKPGGNGASSPEPGPDGTAPREPGQLDPRETLNGAQVKALVELAQAVQTGTLPTTAALQIMQLAFGLSEQEAKAILADVKPDKRSGAGGAGGEPDRGRTGGVPASTA